MVGNRAAVPILMDVYTSSILPTQYVAYLSLSDRAEPNHSETEGELRRYGEPQQQPKARSMKWRCLSSTAGWPTMDLSLSARHIFGIQVTKNSMVS
jgi:hypothetical protein